MASRATRPPVVRRLLATGATGVLSAAFVRYLFVGGLSFALDFLLLAFMREVVGVPVWVATTVAFLVVGVGVNFVLNAGWVFRAGPGRVAQLARYAALVGVNYLVTLGIVVGLDAVGINYLVAKTVAVAVCVLLNFFAYRHWVFRPQEAPEQERVLATEGAR